MQSGVFEWLTIETYRVSRTPEMAKTVGMTRTFTAHKTHWVLNYDNSIGKRQLLTPVAEMLKMSGKKHSFSIINSQGMRTIRRHIDKHKSATF